MEEDAKICFLIKRVENSDLHKSLDALKYYMEITPSGAVTYTTAENNLSTAVSEFPEYVSRNRNVSSDSTGGGYQEGA